MLKKFTVIMSILLVLFLPLLFLLTDVQIATFDMSFYEKKYDEYNIPAETGIEKNDLMLVTKELLDYLKGKREHIKIFTKVHGEEEQVFENRELLHLEDVRELFRKGFFLRNLALVICVIGISYLVLFNRERLRKTIIISSIFPLLLILILTVLLKLDFHKYFTYFHLIFFTNDLWLLNPKTDILIQMYPLDFFYSIAFRILKLFVSQMVILLIIAFITPKIKKYKRFV